MGNCLHEWKEIPGLHVTDHSYFLCTICAYEGLINKQSIPDYYNSLDLLRPAEMKLDNEKFVQYVGLVINSQYGEVRFDDVCSALMALASIRATALAEVIGGIE